jgi:hypothetical protein
MDWWYCGVGGDVVMGFQYAQGLFWRRCQWYGA